MNIYHLLVTSFGGQTVHLLQNSHQSEEGGQYRVDSMVDSMAAETNHQKVINLFH